jgi:hypothetical protein
VAYAAEQKRADVARARRRWMREQGMFDPARLVFIDETCTNTAMVRLRGRAPRGERLVGYAPAWIILRSIRRTSTRSSLKAHLRKAAEHTILRLLRRIGRVVTDFSPCCGPPYLGG